MNSNPVSQFQMFFIFKDYWSSFTAILLQLNKSKVFFKQRYSFFPTTYVQYLQQSGAQIIPILYDDTEENILGIMQNVNGIFFPGGDAQLWNEDRSELSYFSKKAQYIFEQAIKMNSQMIYPIWGTCQGFELMLMAITNDPKTLSTGFNNINQLHNLEVLGEKYMYKDVDHHLLNWVSENKVIHYYHDFGIKLEDFQRDKRLTNILQINSVSSTKNGTKFVAGFEGKNLPIYGVQYHPEENIYIHTSTAKTSNHYYTIEFSQKLSNYFVQKARENQNKFLNEDLKNSLLIENYQISKGTEYMEYVFQKQENKI